MFGFNKKSKKLEKYNESNIQYDSDLIDLVTTEFQRRKDDRIAFELQWRLNINFIEGNQYIDINTVTQALSEVPQALVYETRNVYNQMAPIIETRLAKLKRLNPVLKVRPATSDKEDLSSAKVCNKILESTQKDQDMKNIQMEANTWMEHTGTGFIKPVWNPNKGRKVGIIGGSVENEETGKKENFERFVREGNIETVAVSPFEIFPDSNFNTTVEKCNSIIHARSYHIKDIENIWGVEVEGREINVFTLEYNSTGIGSMGVYNTSYSVSTQSKKDNAIVYEYWEKPCAKYPNGRLIICTDDKLLYAGKIPYKDHDGEEYVPIIQQKCTERPNCFWGKSVGERLIPIQRQYNALKNRKTDYMNLVSIGVLTYEEGTVDSDILEMEGLPPGSMLPRKPGSAPPTFIQPAPLPSTFEMEEQNLLKDFNRISGVSEISRDSAAPTGVSSGIAIGILQEQDDTRLSLTGEYIEMANLKLGEMWLWMYKQFVKMERITRSVGQNMDIDVVYWAGKDITSFDVYLDGSSALSETPAQRKQTVIDMFNMGIFNDPDTGRITRDGQMKILQKLEFGDWEFSLADDELHKQRATRENRMAQMEEPIQVRQYDEDVIHMNEHVRFMLSAEYDDLVDETPEIDALLNAHIDEHVANMQAKMPQPPMEQAMPPEATAM